MSILRLYPKPAEPSPLEGLYLNLNLHRQAGEGEMLIYSNFVASLDGRISSFDPLKGDYGVPATLANDCDWRLYQELAAQSDILITSARYFRQLSNGTAQDLLPVGDSFDDLKQWRLNQGLKPQPDIAILSNSLDIPPATLEKFCDRKLVVFTSETSPVVAREALESADIRVIPAGKERVEGRLMKRGLVELGYRSAYLIAGPAVHSTMIEDGELDRLFLTTRFTLLGSEQTHGFHDGGAVGRMRLLSLYLDMDGAQLFAQYELEKR